MYLCYNFDQIYQVIKKLGVAESFLNLFNLTYYNICISETVRPR